MIDLISRDKLIEAIENQCFDWMHYTTCMYFINAQPPVEPVRGEWQPYTLSKLFTHTCTACHCDVREKTPFCPWCGADMRKQGD